MTVRLLRDEERPRFDQLLEQKHYLCSARMVGRTLRYVAELDGEWVARWEHPVLAVESFVDETRYRGVCYRACGFEAIGATAGFKRASRDFYDEHGEPKQLYMKELQPGGYALLRRGRWPEELAAQEERIAGPCPWQAPALESLLDRFGELRDGRGGHGLGRPRPTKADEMSLTTSSKKEKGGLTKSFVRCSILVCTELDGVMDEAKQAELFKVLGVESRIRIIDLLKQKGPLGVNELSEALGITPSAVSQHLKVLRYAGLVHSERKGYWLPYEIDQSALDQCRELLTEVCACGCKGTGRVREAKLGKAEDKLALLQKYERELKKELEEVRVRIKEITPK